MKALLAVAAIGGIYLYEASKKPTISHPVVGGVSNGYVQTNSGVVPKNTSLLSQLIKAVTPTATQKQTQQQTPPQQPKPSSSGGIGSGGGTGGGTPFSGKGTTGQQQTDSLATLLTNSNFTSAQSIAIENTLRNGGTVADAANAGGVSVESVIATLTGGAISPNTSPQVSDSGNVGDLLGDSIDYIPIDGQSLVFSNVDASGYNEGDVSIFTQNGMIDAGSIQPTSVDPYNGDWSIADVNSGDDYYSDTGSGDGGDPGFF